MEIHEKKGSKTRSENALTLKERVKYLHLLSDEQIQFLNSLGRYRLLEIFEQNNFLSGSNWKFIDYNVSKNYLDKEKDEQHRLFCNCGREIKYQYIVKSIDTSQELSFGITHFVEHFSLPKKAAKEIYQQINLINLRIDEILTKKIQGELFPNRLYDNFKEYVEDTGQGKILFERITRFKQLDLPLLSVDVEEVKRRLKTNRIRLAKERLKSKSATSNKENDKVAISLDKPVSDQSKNDNNYSLRYEKKASSRRLSNKYSVAEEKMVVSRARELLTLDHDLKLVLYKTLQDLIDVLKIKRYPANDFRKIPGTLTIHQIVSLELSLSKFDAYLFNFYKKKENDKYRIIFLNQVIKKPEEFRKPSKEQMESLLKEKEKLLNSAFLKLGISVDDKQDLPLSNRVNYLDYRMRCVNHKRWKGYKRYTDIKGEIKFLTDQLNN